jgi:competence protein ComFC
MFGKINLFFLDTLFPIHCLLCNKGNFWICDDCLEKILLFESQTCPYCEKETTSSGQICPNCRSFFLNNNSPLPLDNLIVATKYKKQNISHLIHVFKYRFISDLHKPLGKLLARAIVRNNLPLPDLIIPVPLHKKRLRWRGFNQAELLAEFIGNNLAPNFPIPVMPELIIRKKYSVPQMKIKKYADRKENIKNAFVINKDIGYNLEGKTVLLIDDVATTGSTLFECGKILKNNGTKKVFGCIIARQEIENK